jgi:hypothetical protein
MLKKITNYLYQIRAYQRINMALSRGAASSALRQIDLRNPDTWEFSGFSQNGEDGVIDVLIRHIKHPNRYFIEIGASDGLENNSTWLAMARRWSGLWVEGDAEISHRSTKLFTALNYGLETVCMFVDNDNVKDLAKRSLYLDPDLLSLDIDGNDYYVCEAILSNGFRPKIFVVEYNSAFGPDRNIMIPYNKQFQRGNCVGDDLYYGCSILSLIRLFESHGYRFLTVDKNGVNAFFVDVSQFTDDFFEGICGSRFRENFAQKRQHHGAWEDQFALIEGRALVEIT